MIGKEKKFGILISYLKMFVGIFIALLFTPVLITKLGKSDYGLYVLTLSFVSYLSVFETGSRGAIVRFILKCNSYSEKGLLATLTIFYFVLSLFILLLGFISLPYISNMISDGLTEHQMSDFLLMYKMTLILVFLTLIACPYISPLLAYEKFIFLRGSELLFVMLTTVTMWVLLIYGYGLLELYFATFFFGVLSVVAKIIFSYKSLGTRLDFSNVNFSDLKPIIFFALPVFIGVFTEQIFWKVDNLVIVSSLGTEHLAVFAIGVLFNKYFMTFSTSISKVMVPSFIKKVDNGASITDLNLVLINVSRLQAHILSIIIVCLIFYGKDFLNLWLGDGFDKSYYIMLWIILPYSFQLIGSLRNTLLQLKSLYWHFSVIYFIISIANVLLTIAIIPHTGVIGAAMVTGVSVLLGYIYINWVMFHKINLNFIEYLVGTFKGIWLSTMLSALFCLILSNSFAIHNWFDLLFHVFISVIFYSFAMFQFALNNSEKRQVKLFFKKM